MSGILRWLTWGDESAWHLRWGTTGRTLCDRLSIDRTRTRWLSEGPPADKCPKCLEVVRFQVGLDKPA